MTRPDSTTNHLICAKHLLYCFLHSKRYHTVFLYCLSCIEEYISLVLARNVWQVLFHQLIKENRIYWIIKCDIMFAYDSFLHFVVFVLPQDCYWFMTWWIKRLKRLQKTPPKNCIRFILGGDGCLYVPSFYNFSSFHRN